MRVLIVADKPDWSYMQIALALRACAPVGVVAHAMAIKGHVREFLEMERSYDRVLIMGHQILQAIPNWQERCDAERWLTGIHSHHAFDPHLHTTPDEDAPPPIDLIRSLTQFRRVNAVSQRLTNLFWRHGVPVVYTPNGVDTTVFAPTLPVRTTPQLRAGVAYTSKHDARKGVQEFIVPACRSAGWKLVEAKARSTKYVMPEDMPAWHNTYDVYVCASSSEGFSIAVLEAMASGRAVLSTPVGGSVDCINHGENGLLFARTVKDLCRYLMQLSTDPLRIVRMGKQSRADAVALWDWSVRAPAWWDFILG